MDLIYLILVVALLGFCVYLITTYIPMPEPFKMVLVVIVAVVAILWLLRIVAPLIGNQKLLP